MTYEQTILSPLTVEESRGRLLGFLVNEGFQPTSPSFLKTVTVQRGSKVGQWFATRIEGWFCNLVIETAEAEHQSVLTLRWEINLWGQLGTKADMVAWGALMDACQRVALGQDISTTERAKARKANLLGMTWRACISVSPMLIGIPISVDLEEPLNSLTLAGSGLAAFGLCLLFVAKRVPIFPKEQLPQTTKNAG